MKKIMIAIILLVVLMIPTMVTAQDGSINVNIGIDGENPNVNVSSGDESTFGLWSGDNSQYYINGTNINDLFSTLSGTSQFGPPPQGAFTQGDVNLPMPPAPTPPPATVLTVPSNNYDGEIGELYDAVSLANQEREILADALVKAIGLVEELQGEVDNLYASSLIVDPEAPATDPGMLSTEAMVAMQSQEIAFLKLRLLINEIITLLLLIAAIVAVLKYRSLIFAKGSADSAMAHKATVA